MSVSLTLLALSSSVACAPEGLTSRGRSTHITSLSHGREIISRSGSIYTRANTGSHNALKERKDSSKPTKVTGPPSTRKTSTPAASFPASPDRASSHSESPHSSRANQELQHTGAATRMTPNAGHKSNYPQRGSQPHKKRALALRSGSFYGS